MTSMAAPYLVQANADLDYVLEQIARTLQLTPDQHKLALKHYTTIADWLAADDSPLARFRPWIYPQGSMALETTVRPLQREEYDLDLVCQMLNTGRSALDVFELVYNRIRSHGIYAPMAERMNRCVRLTYAHDFHLDIIPAEPDPARGDTAIVVPDRTLERWTPSNPRGYVAWYSNRSRESLVEMRKKVDPVPRPTPSDEKPALTIAVQLLKRRRDLLCDAETAPRSIVLTTLAAENYSGTDCVFTALTQIVAGIQDRIEEAYPYRITVCNPTNEDEKFCESFEGPGRYDAFKKFINQLQRDVTRIGEADGMADLEKTLTETFGDEPVNKALRSYTELQKAKRDKGTLPFTGAGAGGIAIVTPVKGITHTAPRHSYYGGEKED